MSHNQTPDSAATAGFLTPMQVCERLIGPPEVLGPAVGYGTKAAYHWRRERDGRRPGDLPSVEVVRLLLAHSAAHQLGLTADHLIWGAPEGEIEAILAERGSHPKSHPSLATAGEGDAAPAFTTIRTEAA
jgi:hypothetical protein